MPSRKQMSKKEIKLLQAELCNLGVKESLPKNMVSIFSEVQGSEIVLFLSDSQPLFFRMKFEDETDALLPTVHGAIMCNLPKIVVDDGAIRFICKGADLMRPGIVSIEDEFPESAPVAVLSGSGLIFAVGLALQKSRVIQSSKSGKSVRIVHHIGDHIDNYKN